MQIIQSNCLANPTKNYLDLPNWRKSGVEGIQAMHSTEVPLLSLRLATN